MEGTDEGLVEEEVADRGGVGESVGGLDQIEGVQDEEERKTLDSSTPEPSGPPVVTEDHAEVGWQSHRILMQTNVRTWTLHSTGRIVAIVHYFCLSFVIDTILLFVSKLILGKWV